jgi:hypothetical protein
MAEGDESPPICVSTKPDGKVAAAPVKEKPRSKNDAAMMASASLLSRELAGLQTRAFQCRPSIESF